RRSSGTLPKTPPLTSPIFERTSSEPESNEGRSATSDLTPPSAPLPAGNGNSASQRTAEGSSGDLAPQTRSGVQLPPAQMAEHYYQQGRARFERKEYHAAVHLLREAIKLDSNRAPYHYHLGIALIRNPRTRRDAEQHLAKAAELEPYNAQIRVKLGLLYKEAGLSKKAENYFREALQLDPDNRIAKRETAPGHSRSKSTNAAGSIWKSDVGSIAKKFFGK